MTIRETLHFKGEKEKAYRHFFLKQDLTACRAISYLVIGVMVLLVVVDFFRVPDISWVLFSRLIVCTTFGALIVLTHRVRLTPLNLQLTLLTINIIFLTSIFFMDAMATMPPFFLTNSICVFLFIAVTVSGLWYRFGGLLNISLVVFFIFYHPHSVNSVFQKSQMVNVIISLIISLLVGVVWERNKRIMFLQHAQMNNLLNIFSHDMVTPFNSLSGLLGLYENQALSQSDFNNHISSIKKANASNILLLQNLVKWSKSQMEGFKPNFERVKLNDVVQDVIAQLQSVAHEKNVAISYEPTEVYAFVDEEMVKLVIRNTISNAIKFSNHEGAVEVRSLMQKDSISLRVKDNGIGMSKEEIDNLFGMEVKSKPGTSNERGTGIGLYITKQFVLLNKGMIEVESAQGKGSTIKITFPKA
jgi:signal transduction histidine kinase